MANQSVDPTQSGNLDPDFNPDIQMSSSPQVAVSRQLLVTPTENYIVSEQQKEFTQRALAADLSTKLTPVYDRIEQIKQDIAQNKENQSKQLDANRAEYTRLQEEARQLKSSQEGMTGGAYRTLHIGYDDYVKDINTQKNSLDTLNQQLQEAQKAGDQGKVDALLGKVNDTSDKLSALLKIDPWSAEGQKKYPVRSEETKYIEPMKYAPGWGVGGYIGYGEKGITQRDIMEGSIGGGTVGQSSPATRAAEAARQAQAQGQAVPEVTKSYLDNVVAKFEKNPYDETLTQQDRVLASAYRQLADPTSRYTVTGLSGIAQNLIDAGFTKAQAVAIVGAAPKMTGSAAYQAVGAVLAQQEAMKTKLSEQILSQPTKAAIAAQPTVNLGELKKPFVSTTAPVTVPTEKPADYLAGIRSLFTKTPLGAALVGTPEEKAEAEKSRTQLEKITNLIAPALMVSGGAPKYYGGAITEKPSSALDIFNRLFGAKSGAGDVIRGVSTSAIVPGTLAVSGTEKGGKVVYESGAPAYTTMRAADVSKLVDAVVPLPTGMKQAAPLETGLFSKAFFMKETPEQLKAGSLDQTKWREIEQFGGGSSKDAYADFKAIPSNIKDAYEFKYDNNSRTGYFFIDTSGHFQVVTDNGIWKGSGSEGAFQGLLGKGIDPLQTALNERGDQIKGSAATVANYVAEHGKKIDVQDPAVTQRFYDNLKVKQENIIRMNEAKAADFNENIMRHRYERESGIPVGTLSVTQWKEIQTRQAEPTPLITTLNRQLNPFGADAYEVKLNTVNPYTDLKFQTEKSATIASVFGSLDGAPLTGTQQYVIRRELDKLPIEDRVVADKFLNLYNSQNATYEKLNTSFQKYDPKDPTSRTEVIRNITEYSQYSPEGGKEYLQMLKDVDLGTQVEANNQKISNLSAKSSDYALNMTLVNGKLVPSSGGRTELNDVLNEQYRLIDKIQTPSIRLQYQQATNEALTYGTINKELQSASPSGVQNFDKIVEGLKFATPEQRETLKTQYRNYGEATILSERADKLIGDAPRVGISDTDLSTIRSDLNKNPVMQQVNPKTNMTYAEEITTGLQKVKEGYWTVDDYKKAVPFDIVTTTGLQMREEAAASRQQGGADIFNMGKNFVGTAIAFPGTTIYGTARSLGIGGAAQETSQQSKTADVVMPTFGGVGGIGDTIFTHYSAPVTVPLIEPAKMVGGFAGRTVVESILAPVTIGRTIAGGEKPLATEYDKFRGGAVDYWSRVGGTLAAEPLEKPFTAGSQYVIGWGLGKVFTGISELKYAKLFEPQVAKNLEKIAVIEGKLDDLKPASFSQRLSGAGGYSATESMANPLARSTTADLKAVFEAEEAAKAASRASLYGEARKLSTTNKLWKLADTGVDIAIAAPFAVPMLGDLYATRENPEVTGAKLSGLIIMGAGASNVLGKEFLMPSKIGEAGWSAESIGVRTRMPGSEVESFAPVVSVVRSPVEGMRIPGTSKEFGYSIKFHNPLEKFSAPDVYSTERTGQPVRTIMSAEDEAFYMVLAKNLKSDAKAVSELPGLSKVRRTTRTDALIQEALKELNKVDKTKYKKISPQELEQVMELSAKYRHIGEFENGVSPSGKVVPPEANAQVLSAELVRAKAFSDVNRLSPTGRQLVYDTIIRAGKNADTPLSRALTNAESRVRGERPVHADVNPVLPTKSELIFGEAKIQSANPMEVRIMERFLQAEERTTKPALPESKKYELERSMQKKTSGVGKDFTKFVKPSIVEMLSSRKVPNSEKVAGEIVKGLEDYDSTLYGSIVQDASLRMERAAGNEISPPIARQARDIDAHLKTPNIAAHDFVDRINKAAGDDVVFVDESGNPAFRTKYSKTNDKLYDLHNKDVEPGEFGAEYIGAGFKQPGRLTMTRSQILSQKGLDVISLSEQGSRKFEGSSIFRVKPTTITTETGLSTRGRVVPAHEGRLKDVGDAYALKLYQADILAAEGRGRTATKVRQEADQWLDLWGKDVAKEARDNVKTSKAELIKNIAYDVRKGQLQMPSPALTAAATTAPAQTQAQRSVARSTISKRSYGLSGYKYPYKSPSTSRSTISSRLSSAYVSPSVSRSLSPSISRMASPSPSSPSPSISRSPSPSISSMISPSPSVSKSPSPSISVSPSIYRSPSRYSPSPYLYPKVELPPFFFGFPGGGGGGGTEAKKRRLKKLKIKQPVRTGYELLVSGKNMPKFEFNIGGEKITNKPKINTNWSKYYVRGKK